MKHSTVEHSNVESSSCSPVAATRKRKRQSAGSTNIENVAMDFPFYCALSSLHIAVTRLSMVKYFSERLGLYLYKTFFPRLKMVQWIFFFLFIIIKFSYCCYTFIYDDICLCRKTDIILLGHPLHLVKVRIETGRYHSSNTRAS